ncbi:MAG: redoxin domain-containing protein [Burkholderiales bacterium]|nr:redoxin domain-containing protein [Burkholderiales bacterium]MCE1176710.1 redoxin domain-containing protein [Burkholderiales bacterium]
MARTPSNMLALNTPAPDFALLEPATGKTVRLSDFIGKPLVIAFICNHCPYVIQIREVFTQMAAEYQQRGVAVVAINSNDVVNYPDDSPENMVRAVKELATPSPIYSTKPKTSPAPTKPLAHPIYMCLMPIIACTTVGNLTTRVPPMMCP